MHLQAGRVVTAPAMRLAWKQRGQVDEDDDRGVDPTEGLLHRLPVVADRLQLAHRSIIRTAYLLNWTNSLELAKCVAGQRVYVQLFRSLVRRYAADELSERVGIGVDALWQQAVEEHSAGL